MTLDDGTVVRPEMVMGEARPVKSMLSLFLPSEKYLSSFVEENTDFLGKIADKQDVNHSVEIVHSSTLHNCLSDPTFKKEIF